MHDDLRLPRRPLDIHRPDSVPDVSFTGKLRPFLLGAVLDGGRYDVTPDGLSANQNPQGGVIGGINLTRVKVSRV